MKKQTKPVLLALAALLVVGVIGAEIAARVLFGFSMDEPIVVLDKDCEYRLAPGSHGPDFRVNELSMRCDPVPET